MLSSVHSARCSHLVTCTRARFHPSFGFISAVGSLSLCLWSANCRGSSLCYNSGDDIEKLHVAWSCTAFVVFHFLLLYLLFLLVIIFSRFLFFGMGIFHCFIPQLTHLSVSRDNYWSVPGIAEHLVLLYAVHKRAVLWHTGWGLFAPEVWASPLVWAGLLSYVQEAQFGPLYVVYLTCCYHATFCGLCNCNRLVEQMYSVTALMMHFNGKYKSISVVHAREQIN